LFLWEFLTLKLPFLLTQDETAEFLVNFLRREKYWKQTNPNKVSFCFGKIKALAFDNINACYE